MLKILRAVLLIFCCTFIARAEFGQGTNVRKLANLDFNSAPYSDVYYSNGRAFIGGYTDGKVHIVDVQNDNDVKLLGVYKPSIEAGILDLQARGDLLFCALSKLGFTIVDISDPSQPKEIAFYQEDLPRGVHDLFVTDKFVYLCDNAKSLLHIIDISNIRRPRLAGTLKSDGYTHDLTITGNIGYIANIRGGFRIVDMTNPAKPTVTADHNYFDSFTHNIWPSEDGKFVFTTDETCGTGHLRAFDISDLNNIRQVGEYEVSGSDSVIHNAMVVGDYAYISYYKRGLRIVDVSNPKDMREIASFDTWNGGAVFGGDCFEGAWGVFAQDNGRVYISDIGSGLWVFDFPLAKEKLPRADFKFPRGGEVFGQGETIDIEWTAGPEGAIAEQSLELSLDGGANYDAIASLGGSARNFSFKMPAVSAERGKLRLTVRDNKGRTATAVSAGLFQIVADAPPTIKALFPNGGENFALGETITAAWAASDDRRIVSQSIDLSLDGGASFSKLAVLDGDARQFAIRLPTVKTAQARIKITVSDGVNDAAADASDGLFRISDDASPRVQLKFPNGGEQFAFSRQTRIEWSSADDRGVVLQRVEFSNDGGATFVELARLDGSAQSLLINLPDFASQNCRVRITVDDGFNPLVSSTSASAFAIFEKLPIIRDLSLKTSNPDRLVLDLDPSGDLLEEDHEDGERNGIVPQHAEGHEHTEIRVEIDSGSGYVPYLEPGKVQRDGTRLVTKGKLADGKTTRKALPEGKPVKVRLTNRNGARAEAVVVRRGTDISIQ